jgi:thioredoxin 1
MRRMIGNPEEESMGAPVELTAEKFREVVDREGMVFIDWWAEWCGPCKAFAPTYDAVAADNDDVVFAKIDTEAQPALAGAFQIRSIPTLMAFRDGVLLFSQAGALPRAALEELVGRVRALDMDQVRKEIAAQPPEP